MQVAHTDFAIIYLSKEGQANLTSKSISGMDIRVVASPLTQDEYIHLLHEIPSEKLVLVDGTQITLEKTLAFVSQQKESFDFHRVGYISSGKPKLWLGCIQNLWKAIPGMVSSPILIGSKSSFLKAYGGMDLTGSTLSGIGYSLQKTGGLKFQTIPWKDFQEKKHPDSPWNRWMNFSFHLPLRYLLSGRFFTRLFCQDDKVERDMVFRMLFSLFACFTFLFMPYISKDFGITGDEFVDHRHAGYVLDYFANEDKTALHQPQTALHLYGNSIQVITAAICRWFQVDNYYELRHWTGGLIGALGILAVGWMGLRWGGGLCGLLCLLLMFFTPRFFGHSMNNLKDIPFATGYILAIFYTVRLFDYYPYFRLRHIGGIILGIALALGTRSGGLILYPMLFMYAGLFYILHHGVKDFYKFRKYSGTIRQIFQVLLIVIVGSYFLSISLWPFALERPLSGVLYSLVKFTNYNIGLRTIFDGEQMMSNMLPWKYAPQYLCIGMPIVTLIGFFFYWIYMVIRKKEFSLISFFLLFATIFPVFWVIYCNSNLYGGIRHLLFVMPPMVVLAGRFWSEIIGWCSKYVKLLPAMIFIVLFTLPVAHTYRNHPNEYVYFNEFVGGLKNVYGDYETDYYFNSLKSSAEWFREHILPGLPKDKKTIIATQAAEIVQYYFRHDTNIKVSYSRYYEKHSKDWDYAIFGNVYISPHQLKNQLFPPAGYLYAPYVDGFPMSFVSERETKTELQGFQLEKDKKYAEAIQIFKEYLKEHPSNEEVWSKLGKIYYLTEDFQKSKETLNQALSIHPALNEALYISALTHIELKDFAMALKTVDRMLMDNSSSADVLYLKALVYYHSNRYQQAIEVLNHLLSFRPNYDKAHVLAGDIFRNHGNYEQAAKIYEQALKIQSNANTAILLADTWVRLRKYKQAEELLKQIKQFQPSFYPIYKVECRMFLQEKRLKEVDHLLKKMEQINNDAELWVLKAMYAEAIGDIESKREMLKQALVIDPNNIEALKMKKGF